MVVSLSEVLATAVGAPSRTAARASLPERLRATVAILERRGYAVPPARLGELCLGGPADPGQVLAALPAAGLRQQSGLVTAGRPGIELEVIGRRQAGHRQASELYRREAEHFARTLAAWFPFVLSVSIAGSLASGGFRETDDVDLNLVVEDGRRHLAYVALNLLGILHALRHRRKPVDAHTARPLVPRLMTANLVLERSDCFPLRRTDPDMAYELLVARPAVGAGFLRRVYAANPRLGELFPQLDRLPAVVPADPPRRLPGWLFPAFLDRPARWLGRAAWRYMQWTRRNRPEALARVAFVRATMRPYALFDDAR
jgi:hypothetical protein